jgi:hypothetical protein
LAFAAEANQATKSTIEMMCRHPTVSNTQNTAVPPGPLLRKPLQRAGRALGGAGPVSSYLKVRASPAALFIGIGLV